MKKLLKVAWVGLQVWRSMVSGNHQGEVNMLARLMETQTGSQPASAGCVWEGLSQGKVVPASVSLWEKAVPPALALKPDSPIPLCMSLAFFKLLTQCWSSEQMSRPALKSRHRLFKRSAWDSSSLQPYSATISTVFSQPEVMGTSLPGTGTPS